MRRSHLLLLAAALAFAGLAGSTPTAPVVVVAARGERQRAGEEDREENAPSLSH